MKKLIKRTVALVLCAMLLLGAVPLDILPKASASSWADPYMDKMKRLGIMTGGRPNDPITRAEMAVVLNQAFGFTRTGPIPFTDVPRGAWYYDAIAISYNSGIMAGTSKTTASPNSPLTREQALTFFGCCLRYDESPITEGTFTDYQKFGVWSAKYVKAALLAGIISGYPNGSFGPKDSITRGQIACMMSAAIGELVTSRGATSTPVVSELGGVFGNVTINSPNVTLRNTTIAGNLYLTGGIDLGNVILDNVKVLGDIIVAGGGVRESGEASVQLNNVTANRMIVDPATGQYVSLRALGNTDIAETIVRSNAYIQDDVRNNEMGLRKVIFEEPAGGRFTIAGNMKDVTLKAPDSLLIVGDTGTGGVAKITVDENATNSEVRLEINANVDEINLDTAASVTGTGDIGNLHVSANGCSSSILPNTAEVDPGVITEIAGMTGIDREKAKELSNDPMLLEGYPKVKNIAPTSATAYFSTNRPGKLYWALTDAAKGPLTDADVETLIEQPSYGSGFMKAGVIDISSSKTEYVLTLNDKNLLTQGGTYYISAVLAEPAGQKRRSPVKSQRFVTPDGTKPAMASTTYPSISDLTPTRNEENAGLDFYQIANLQATVMANKNCDLYYVLLPSGSTAPTTNEFLSGAFPNPYGYGRLHLIKNTLESFKINEIYSVDDLDGNFVRLGEVKENTSYDLYYWLTDADGEQSSNVIKYKSAITTKDITPPEFLWSEMDQSSTKANAVTLSNSVNEDSTVYWVAVPSGSAYPKHNPEVYPNTDSWREFLKDEHAKIQITAGAGIANSKSGKVTAKANTQFNITISGLQRESAYDVYYLAQDKALNYSPIFMYTAHTLDETPPTASLRFESCPEESPETPYAYSTIDVIFSEAVRYRQPANSPVMYSELRLIELYNNYKNASPSELSKAEAEYVGALKDTIILCTSTGSAVKVRDWNQSSSRTDWVVDYRNVQVHQDGTKMVVKFVNDPDDLSKSALNLESGAQYYFHLQRISDDSQSRNEMHDHDMDVFTTVSARVGIRKLNDLELKAFKVNNGAISSEPVYVYNDITTKYENTRTDTISADIAFTATPDSTSTTADGIKWDMIFWFDIDVEFMLFTRVHGSNDGWIPVGGVDSNGDPKTLSITAPSDKINYTGVSVVKGLTSDGTSSSNPQYHDINEPYKLGLLDGGLNDSDGNSYDFALYFTKVGGRSDRASFDQKVSGQVTFVTGGAASLNQFSPASVSAYDELRSGNSPITDVTWPNKNSDLTNPSTRLLTKQFVDGRSPVINTDYPRITPTSSGADVRFAMSSPGTIYYVLAPKTTGGENFVVTPQKNNSNGRPENISYADIEAMIPECGSNGPIGHQYTMASDLSVMERMFPDDFLLNDGSPNSAMAGYKFDSPVTSNITNVQFSNVASSQLISDSVKANNAENSFNLTGLAPDTEYLMYLVTTTGNSSVYSPVTVYRFKTNPVVKPTVITQATGADATINTDQPSTNVVYKLIPNDNTMNPLFQQQFYSSTNTTSAFNSYRSLTTIAGVRYDSANFTVLDAMIETVTASGKQQSLFDVCASSTLKQQVANIIDGRVADGGSSLGKVEGVINNGYINFMCDDVWKDMGNSEYCLIVYGYCGVKTNDVVADKMCSFSASRPIAKRREKIQVTVNNGLYFTPDDYSNPSGSGRVGGTLSLTFTDALYYVKKTGNTSTKVPLRNTPLMSGSATGQDGESIRSHLSIPSEVNILGEGADNWTQPLYDLALDFNGLQNNGIALKSFTVSLHSGPFAGQYSDAQESGLTLTVRVDAKGNVNITSSATTKDWLKTAIVNPK